MALAARVDPRQSKTPDLNEIHGLVADWIQSDYIATTVCLADGTTSLYLSNGGGVIGAGEHLAVEAASIAALRAAASVRNHLEPGTDTALPTAHDLPAGTNVMRFTLITSEGLRSAEAPLEVISEGAHVLSALGDAVQCVIHEIHHAPGSTPAESWWTRLWHKILGR